MLQICSKNKTQRHTNKTQADGGAASKKDLVIDYYFTQNDPLSVNNY
ncbi:hypothetical protein [Nitrosopumilus sp.]|nr:hypothetical protein [Nitrosopumilus sp.]